MGDFKLAVIGAGIFAEANIYPSLSTYFFDDIDRVAVCDIDEKRAHRLAKHYGWPAVYGDFSIMIQKEKPDAVIVCTGARTHPDIVVKVLDMGLPVYMEKPSSIDLKGTLRILEASKKAGKFVQVGHQKRHGLAYEKARQIVSNRDEFGSIIQIESKMHGFTVFPTMYTCMLEWQCHNLDLVVSFGGAIKEIEAKSHMLSDRTGALTAMLRFESGALGTLGWGTFGGPGQFAERLEVLGDKGKGVIVNNAREVTYYTEDTGSTWAPDWNPISQNQSHVFNGYVGELRHFIDCVKEGRRPIPSIEDEARTMGWLTEIAQKAGIPIEWAPVSSAL